MCGICGIYNFSSNNVDKENLELMIENMKFRGPDSSGIYVDNNFGMAMTRLAIIDVKNGQQPMSCYENKIHIVFNGEIFNYREIKLDLVNNDNIKFKNNSDTEVIIYLYKKYGENLYKYINGNFAFSIWDSEKKILLIYRDHLGVKPLFYSYKNNKFIFSSNTDTIYKLVKNKTKLDQDSIATFFLNNYIPGEKTLFQNIKKLLPGHYIKIANNNLEIKKFWELKKKNNLQFCDNKNLFKEVLFDAIKIQSRTDVPFGTFLSGGVDSSIITYLLKQLTDKNFTTFTVNFLKKNDKDPFFANQIAQDLNLEYNQLDLDIENLSIDVFDRMIKFLDQPIADTAIFPFYLLSNFANNKGCKVIITGAGADEVFGGYQRYYATEKDFLRSIIPEINIINLLNLSHFLNKDFLNYLVKIFSTKIDYAISTSGASLNFLNKILKNQVNFKNALLELNGINKKINTNFLSKKFYYSRAETDLLNYLPDNILALADKCSMAASVECRVPFLDYRIVEFVFNNQFDDLDFVKFNNSKIILKKIFYKQFKKIFDRKKTGFNSPIKLWVSNHLSEIKEELANNSLKNLINTNILFNKKNFFLDKDSQSIFALYMISRWTNYRGINV